MGNLERLEDKGRDLAIYYLEPLEADEVDEIEYLEKLNREYRDHILRLQDAVKGTDNERLRSENYDLRIAKVYLETGLRTAKILKEKAQQKERQWQRCYNEIKGRLDSLMVEAALAYAEWKSDDMPEMSPDEMYDFLVAKAEDGRSTPLSGYYESPQQVHERLGQSGLL